MKSIKQPVKIETVQMFRYHFCHSLISKKTVYYFVSSKFSWLLILRILFENLFSIFPTRQNAAWNCRVDRYQQEFCKSNHCQFQTTGSIGPKPRTGRRPKANERSIRNLLRMTHIYFHLSAWQLQNDWTNGHLYTVDGVRKVLNKYGLNRRVVPKNIEVLARHRLLGKMVYRQMLKNHPYIFQNGSQPTNHYLSWILEGRKLFGDWIDPLILVTAHST